MRRQSVAVFFFMCWSAYAGTYGGGEGTVQNPYQIWNLSHFNELAATTDDYDKSFILMADLDFAGIVFTHAPIAPDNDPNKWGPQGPAFNGSFEGNSHVIYNLTVDNPAFDYNGLFGYVESKAVIKNLTLENVSITGGYNIGGLAASSEGLISNCHVDGTIGGNYPIGGLTGFNDGGTIEYCSSTCTIHVIPIQRTIKSSTNYASTIGGLIGAAQYGTISDSWSRVTIQSDMAIDFAGGLVGTNNAASFEHCWAVADFDLKKGRMIGGFCGRNFGSLRNCIAAEVQIKTQCDQVGGLVGFNSSLVAQCVAEGVVSSNDNCGGLIGQNEGYVIDSYSSVATNADVLSGGFTASNHYGILRCYSLGAARCRSFLPGGFVGENSGYIDLCFWDIETSGVYQSEGGEGMNSEQLKKLSTYKCWGDGVWVIEEALGYPKLIWENTPGIVIEDEPAVYGGGSGTDDDPYLIDTPEQLALIGQYPQDLAKCYKLTSDLDMEGIDFYGIGVGFGFEGTFDGNGHRITNLKLNGTLPYTGLFCVVLKRGTVKNLNVLDYHVQGTDFVGGLTGKNEGSIENCYTRGKLLVLNEKTSRCKYGGLAGSNQGTITGCRAEVEFISLNPGAKELGGLIGCNSGIIRQSCASGLMIIAGSNSYLIGGFIGFCAYDSKVYDCYCIVDLAILGKDCHHIGGFTGRQGFRTRIERSYAAGSTQIGSRLNENNVAGFVGENGHQEEGHAAIEGSFWNIETSGFEIGVASNYTDEEPQGLTTMQMQDIIPYKEASWSIDSEPNAAAIWNYFPEMYPELSCFVVSQEQ